MLMMQLWLERKRSHGERESLTREALFLYKIIRTIAYVRKKL